MDNGDLSRDRSSLLFLIAPDNSQTGQLRSEKKVINDIRNDNTGDGFPTEAGAHEANVPGPFGRNHDHRRRRKICKRSTDRNVYKQQTKRRICKAFAGLERIKSLPK